MDELPDELLLRILGHLDDGRTLLDAVPLVCKRWHRLSREREAWADVAVEVLCCAKSEDCPYYKYDRNSYLRIRFHNSIFQGARVILRAAFLRRLSFRLPNLPSKGLECIPLQCEYEVHVVMSALRRTSATVRELILPAYNPVQPLGRAEMLNWSWLGDLLDFVGRSRASLRVLQLGPLLQRHEVQRALFELKALESLCLVQVPGIKPTGLDDVPLPDESHTLPRLRHLKVDSLPHERYKKHTCWNGLTYDAEGREKQYPLAFRPLAFLIRCAAGSLRQLHFNLALGLGRLCPAVAAEVRGCEGLRELSCSLLDAAVLPALPQLQRLTLTSYKCCFAGDDGHSGAAATSALHHGRPLTSLRCLHVVLDLGGRSYDINRGKEGKPRLESLIKALASAASEVTTLMLSVVGDWALAAPFLEGMPRLRSVELRDPPCIHSPLRMLPLLAALPELQELVAPGLTLPDVDEKADVDSMTVGEALGRLGCLRSLTLFRCPAEALAVLADLPELRRLNVIVTGSRSAYYDVDGCQAAIEAFKLRRPDVKGDIEVDLSLLDEYYARYYDYEHRRSPRVDLSLGGY